MATQPRYEAYLKTTTNPCNWGYLAFISKMRSMYNESKNKPLNSSIDDHDLFTKFIEAEVKK